MRAARLPPGTERYSSVSFLLAVSNLIKRHNFHFNPRGFGESLRYLTNSVREVHLKMIHSSAAKIRNIMTQMS
jgi:hypothetical protein